MITLTVEAILVVLLGIVLMNLFKRHQSTPAPGPLPDLANLKPTDAQAGDVISVSGVGDDFSDLDFTADRCTWVQAGTRHWTELSGLYRERRVSMRAATNSDGDVEVAVHADGRKLAIEDFGLSEPDLADLDERQNTGDYFEFDNKTWLYRLSREAQATGTGQPASFYYWEFQEKDGPGLLAIRKAEGEPFIVTAYTSVAPGNVTVYRASK
ncbi:MAG TPA: hypothetical protein VGH38_05560 [Bryobacteraceae bacterium]|jgi:hypothetical protein